MNDEKNPFSNQNNNQQDNTNALEAEDSFSSTDEEWFSDSEEEQKQQFRDGLKRKVEGNLSKIFREDDFRLVEITKDIIRKADLIFVKPEDYISTLRSGETYDEKRLFVVWGDEAEWNFLCGLHFGMELLRQKGVKGASASIYHSDAYNRGSLISFVQRQAAIKEDAKLYIMQNVFENGLSREELAEVYLSKINRTLQDQRSYLILTTCQEKNLVGIESFAATLKDNGTLLDKYLNYYERGRASDIIYPSIIKQVRNKFAELLLLLEVHSQIKLFFDKLRRLPAKSDEAKLLDIAGSLANLDKRKAQKEASKQFTKLSPNARLYAMLAVLLNDLDKQVVEEIYAEAVYRLREQGITNLCDVRELGVLDLLEEMQAELGADGRIHFTNSFFEAHIRKQQLENYHLLLWSLMEMVYGFIELRREERYTGFRQALGRGIGQLGKYHQVKLVQLLERLAHHEDRRVAFVSAYALDELCRQNANQYEFVTALLTKWTHSIDQELMWLAGVTIGEVYAGIASKVKSEHSRESRMVQRLKKLLSELAATFDHVEYEIQEASRKLARQRVEAEELDDVRREALIQEKSEAILGNWLETVMSSVTYAIRSIARTHATDAVELVIQWLKDNPNSYLCLLGESIAEQLFADHASSEIILVEPSHKPLLDLIGPVLSLAIKTKSAVQTLLVIMNSLELWLRNNEKWRTTIHRALLRVVNRASLDERALLRARLSDSWLQSEEVGTRQIGQALIVRSYVCDGVPLDMPNGRYALLALDASYRARLGVRRLKTGLQLFERLSARLDTYLFLMGEANWRVYPEKLPTLADVSADHNMPRLLAAALDRLPNLEQEKVHVVLALAWDEILDGKDLDDSSWQDKLLIASPEQSVKWSDNLPFVYLKRRYPTSRNLEAIEHKLNQRLGQRLATLEADDWWRTLKMHLQSEATDLDGICAQLTTWARKLDEVEKSSHRNDIARLVACTILWLAKIDMTCCVSLIQSWLASPQEQTEHLMGLACAKQLFNVYKEQVPPSIPLPPLLDLVAPMARTKDWGAIKAILESLRRWLVEPKCAQLFLRGHAIKAKDSAKYHHLLALLVEYTPAINHRELKKTIEKWKEDKDAPEAVHQVAEQMFVRLLLGEGGQLPDLPADQKYAVLLLDASHGRGQTLPQIAIQVIEELTSREATKNKFYPITYRLGQRIPVALEAQLPSFDDLLPSLFPYLPPLAAPLLEQLSLEQVAFILLLSNKPPLDQDEWLEAWQKIPILAYTTARKNITWPSPVKKIPQARNKEKASKTIIETLLRTLKGLE